MNNSPAAPAPGDHRHFMSLGGDFPLPPKKVGVGTTGMSTSFIAPREAPAPNHLPDIYTTCPELRKFSMIFSIPEVQSKPAPVPAPAPPEPPKPPRPPPPIHPAPIIPMQPFPRFAMPMAMPFFHVFDPNAHVIRPHELGFVPKSEWPPQVFTLWDLRQMYFTRRNGAGRRFDFKLYNALCITKAFPTAYALIGAAWIGPTVMKIQSQIFANLLGIHAVQGGLFHKQGNFSRHGFQQVMRNSPVALGLNVDLRDVDDYSVRLFTDQHNRFSRDTEFVVTEEMLNGTENDNESEETESSGK